MEAKMKYGPMGLVSCGASNSVYLIPAEDGGIPEVFVWGTVGSGCPEPAWHHRWLRVCRVPERAVESAIEAVLRAHEDELLELAGFYQGAEWNGHNHVGSWGDEADDDRMGVLREKISDAMGEVERYWEASDWYEPVTLHEVVTSDLSLDDLVAHEVHTAAGDAALDEDDVRDWIVSSARAWLDKHDDPDEDDGRDEKLRTRLCKLLAEVSS